MKSIPYYLLLMIMMFGLTISNLTNAATLTSNVNRNELGTNETLTLTVSIDQQVNSSKLDLNPLRENFEILAATPQSRSSINVVNGQSERNESTTWTITLVAKNEGILTIPSFRINSASSRPISIKVNNATKTKSSSLPLEVWVSTNAKEVYPNQQFIVEVELSARNNVRDLNGPQLVIPNAEVEAFDQQNFQRVDNGITRQVVVLKYSVFASQVGELTIPIMTYTGLENGRRSVFGTTGKQVIARSEQLTVIVKDTPAEDGRQWFPADDVTISSSWSTDTSKLVVGEPVTRTITVTAKGQQASAIPPISHPILDQGLKSYKDQAQLETSKSTQGFVATRVESEAIVANQAGDFVMPELVVKWWNTNTKKWQTSTLKQQTLSVSGLATPLSAPPEALAGSTSIAASESGSGAHSTTFWQIISGILGLLVLLQFYMLTRRPQDSSSKTPSDEMMQSERANWTALQTAIKSDNSRAIRNSLLIWGRTALKADAAISLDTLLNATSSKELRQLFKELDQHLYHGDKKPNSREIGEELKELRSVLKEKTHVKAQQKSQLKPLYPSQSN